jgi:hypothetical protein
MFYYKINDEIKSCKKYSEIPFNHLTIENESTHWKVTADGTYYYNKKKIHRKNLPARIDDLFVCYYENNRPHKEDGPALMFHNGYYSFWLCGKNYLNVKDWLTYHPNQDNVFQIEMLLRYS